MQTIAVPYDFSEYAEAALDFAIQIGEKTNATIRLIHVIEYPLATTFNVTGEVEEYEPMDKIYALELIKKTNERMAKVISDHNQNVTIQRTILMGKAYDGITDQIEETEADLIVMGTKGATGLKELFVGSNTEKIVRNAHCPVLAIHKKCDINAIKNVVFASDLDGTHSKVLQTFKYYQELFDAKLHLVWVDTPHNSVNGDLAKERLKALAIDNHLKNYEVHVTKAFQPEEGILTFGWQIKADLIAMSTHSHKGLIHLFVGSVAEDVVNHSNLPVWTCTIK
ncbi:Nucleotide-binding universal stress protein, UspA family [Reichenbachiella faecimaris]|uniref:Nucleotide-binding universal stress protein, UspA family n=1 Tax=Reichenbachiella faecimaris TaxID=692418 RepID=A0A1W2G5K5_REIFA|nr:universal stress protein [Reichenbachiella faecimaris]SMD31959.1 Nucleotide-binding universal stress protein, UspA family [Reichenbachiella faecimaris]